MNTQKKLNHEYINIFNQSYSSKIKPLLIEFEQRRKNTLNNMWTLIGIALCSIIAINCYFYPDILHRLWLFWTINLTGLLVLSLIAIFFNRQFIKTLKTTYLKQLLQIIVDIQHTQNLISYEELIFSELFPRFNRKHCYNCYYGEHKNIKFEIADLNLSHQHNPRRSYFGKRRYSNSPLRETMCFSGLVIKLTLKQPFKYKTLVAPKNDNNIRNNIRIDFETRVYISLSALFLIVFIGGFIFKLNTMPVITIYVLIVLGINYICDHILNGENNNSPMKRINSKISGIDDNFKIYSNNEKEASSIITQDFMDRFLNLPFILGARSVKCAFFDKYIMIALPSNKTFFEFGNLFKKIDDPKQIIKIFEEFASILILLDYFAINKKDES